MFKKINKITIIFVFVILISLFTAIYLYFIKIHNYDNEVVNEQLKEVNPLVFYSNDDYQIIRMLINWIDDEWKKYIKNNSRFYFQNKLFNWIDSDNLNDDINTLIKCIIDYNNNGKINNEFYYSNIKNEFMRWICLWEDKIINNENVKRLRDVLIIQLKSYDKKDDNFCKNIPKEEQSLDYFLCIWLAYKNFDRVNNLMKKYVDADYQTDWKRCNILKPIDDYLYDTCKSYNKIWEVK